MTPISRTLKNELVHHRRYTTRVEAKTEITEYIEIFYNRQRRHGGLNNQVQHLERSKVLRWDSKLGNLSPAAFAQQALAKQAGA